MNSHTFFFGHVRPRGLLHTNTCKRVERVLWVTVVRAWLAACDGFLALSKSFIKASVWISWNLLSLWTESRRCTESSFWHSDFNHFSQNIHRLINASCYVNLTARACVFYIETRTAPAFTLMHLSEATYSTFKPDTFNKYMCPVGFQPTTLTLKAHCCTTWATKALIQGLFDFMS